MGVNVGGLPWGKETVAEHDERTPTEQGPAGGLPGVFFPPYTATGGSVPLKHTESFPREPQTVEEEAAVKAAQQAEFKAMQAEEHSRYLRKSMKHQIDSLQQQIETMKTEMAAAKRFDKVTAENEKESAQQPHWEVVPLHAQRLPRRAVIEAAAAGAEEGMRQARRQFRPQHLRASPGRGGERVRHTSGMGSLHSVVMPPGGSELAPKRGESDGSEPQFLVLRVSEDGRQIEVQEHNSGRFGLGPDRMAVTFSDGGEQILPYAVVKLTKSRTLLFTGAPGVVFSADATYARPAPQRRFQVTRVSEDGQTMAIDCANDGSFPEAPARLRLVLATGEEALVTYASMEVRLGDVLDKDVAEGDKVTVARPQPVMVMTAQRGCAFAQDAVYAAPLQASVWATQWRQGHVADSEAEAGATEGVEVEQVEEGGQELLLALSAKHVLSAPPARVSVHLQGSCAVVDALYVRVRSLEDSGTNSIALDAAPGHAFPDESGAVVVSPDSQPMYSVFWRADDGSRIRVQAPDDGSFPAVGGRAIVERGDGSEAVYKLAHASQSPADELGPAGLMLEAQHGTTFPVAIVRVGPGGGELVTSVASSVRYLDNEGAEPYDVGQRLEVNARLYVDKEYVFTSVPQVLQGHPYIRTAQADADDARASLFLTFSLAAPSDVYVLFDASASAPPHWLSTAFFPNGATCQTSSGALAVWRAKEPLSGAVYLGGNAAPPVPAGDPLMMYSVVIAPAAASPPRPPMVRIAAEDGRALQYPVVKVGPAGRRLRLAAQSLGSFRQHGGKVQVQRADGSLADYPVASVEALDLEETGGVPAIELSSEADHPFPVDAVAASPAAQYSVVFVSDDGSEIRIDAANDGTFPRGPGRVKLLFATDSYADFAYEELRATHDGLQLIAPRGSAFPVDAMAAAPGAFPLSALVTYATRSELRVSAPSDWIFPPAPSHLRITTAEGEETVVPYSALQHMPADVNGPAGLQFTSKAGEAFPLDARSLLPAEYTVVSVEPSGKQLVVQVPGARAFPAGPCAVELSAFDGDRVKLPYTSAALLPTPSNGVLHMLITAAPGVKFPRLPSFAAPACPSTPYRAYKARTVLFSVLRVDQASIPGVTPTFVLIQAEPDGTFHTEGGYIKTYSDTGAQEELAYDRAEKAVEQGTLLLKMQLGVVFPASALEVSPVDSAVIAVSTDKSMIQVASANDGSWRPGPGKLVATVKSTGHVKRVTVPYLTIAHLPAGGPSGGMLVTAAAGHTFPNGLLSVRPAVAETAPPPAKSKVLHAEEGEITVEATSPFPAKGYVDLQLPDGKKTKVKYDSARLAPGAMTITLAGGESVEVPPENVKKVPASAIVTLSDDRKVRVPQSAVSDAKADPAHTFASVTLPDGQTVALPLASIAEETGAWDGMDMMSVRLPDGQTVQVPKGDVSNVPVANIVTLEDGRRIKVPSWEVRENQHGQDPGTARVHLPDGTDVTVPKDDVEKDWTIGLHGQRTVEVKLDDGKRISVLASTVHHPEGTPSADVAVQLPDGRVQIVPRENVFEKDGALANGLVQVRLPNGLYALIERKHVKAAPPPLTVTLPGGKQYNVPRANVHFPPKMKVVILDDGSKHSVLPSAVRLQHAHLRVELPDGQLVNLASSSVHASGPLPGETTQLLIKAAPGEVFPVDAMYATPAADPPYEVVYVTGDASRMVVVAPPGVFPHGPSRVEAVLATGKKEEVPYVKAQPLPGDPVGPRSRVLRVSDDRTEIEIEAPTDLPAGPGWMLIFTDTGKAETFPYHAVHAAGNEEGGGLVIVAPRGTKYPSKAKQIAPAGPHKMLLVTGPGLEFPAGAMGALPVRNSVASFVVVGVDTDGGRMRVEAPDDGTFPPGPGVLRVRIPGGATRLSPYDSVASVVPDDVGPAGLVFMAPLDMRFPEGAERVEPTAGFGNAGSDVTDVEQVEVVTNASSTEAVGPACSALSVGHGGSDIMIGPYGLLMDKGGEADVFTRGGERIRLQYSEVEPRVDDFGEVEGQVVKPMHGQMVPEDAVSVQPLVHQPLQVGSLVEGAELYSDDPSVRFVNVPETLEGVPMVMTDNAARGAPGADVLEMTVWGWSTVFVLRPDLHCDGWDSGSHCQYLSWSVPRWLSKGFKPRPELAVYTSRGKMAVWESLRPAQGRLSFGGNADLPPEQLHISRVTCKGATPCKVAVAVSQNAAESRDGTSLYVDLDDEITSLPPLLEGQPMVQTSSKDASSSDPALIAMELSCPSDCFVLRDNTQTPIPRWLSAGFEEESGLEVATTKKQKLSVMRSKLPLHGRVELGGNQGDSSMYAVICTPSSVHITSSRSLAVVGVKGIQVADWTGDSAHGREDRDLVETQETERLYVGQGAFVDAEDVRFLTVPDPIAGATLVRTAVADRHSTAAVELRFNVSEPVDVYVLRHDSAPLVCHSILAVSQPGSAAGAPPSPVLFISQDRSRVRVRASVVFPAAQSRVVVRLKNGKEVEVPYSIAQDAGATFDGNDRLIPGGLELIATKGGPRFPTDAISIVPTAATSRGGVSAVVVRAGENAIPPGPGIVVVRGAAGEERMVRYKTVQEQEVIAGEPSRVVVVAEDGESFPAHPKQLCPASVGPTAIPQWLASGFKPTDMLADTTMGSMFVYKSRLPVHGRVVLGGNAAAPSAGSAWGNYVVALLPAGYERKGWTDMRDGAWGMDNYLVAVKPLGRSVDLSPGAHGSRAIGAESIFKSAAQVAKDEAEAHKPWWAEPGGESSVVMDTQESAVLAALKQFHAAEVPSQFPVVGVEAGGSKLLVQVPAVGGSFQPASPSFPRRVEVVSASGLRSDYTYVDVTSQLTASAAHPPVLVLSAAPGSKFPDSAVAASPAAEYLVASMSKDGTVMEVAAADSAVFGAGGGHVKVRLSNLAQVQLPVASIKVVHQGGSAGEGVLVALTAPAGSAFPADALSAGPAAVPPSRIGWGARGTNMRFKVESVEGGWQMVLRSSSATSFPPGPDKMTVATPDGKTKTFDYQTVATLPRDSDGVVRLLVSASEKSSFPPDAEYVIPERFGNQASSPPADSKPGQYVVTSVDHMGHRMRILAPNDGTFLPGPGEVWASSLDSAPQKVSYTAMELVNEVSGRADDADSRDEEGAVVLLSPPGAPFDRSITMVSPVLAQVISVRADGMQLQIRTPADGTFRPGPGTVVLQMADFSRMNVQYETAAALPPWAEAGGVLLTAKAGSKFPLDARFAEGQGPPQLAVCAANAEGTEIRVNVKDDGTLQAAPGRVELVLRGGDDGDVEARKAVWYESLASVPAQAPCPAGLVLRGDFGQDLMAALVAVVPLKGPGGAPRQVLGNVKCDGKGVCGRGVLEQGRPMYAESALPELVSVPDDLRGLEYIRTLGDTADGDAESGAVHLKLLEASDVFVLVPRVESHGEQLPVARVGGGGAQVVVVVPADMEVPGPFFPAGPWSVTVKTASGLTFKVPYKEARTLTKGSDESGEGSQVAVIAAAGHSFPMDSDSCAVALGMGRPAWLARDFRLTSMTATSTAGPIEVYESNAPLMGAISLGSRFDAPRAKPVMVSLIKPDSQQHSAAYQLGLLRVGSRLYVDEETEFVDIPTKLAGVTYIQTAEADADSKASAPHFLRFTVEAASHVMVIFDDGDRTEDVPAWLASGWEHTQMRVQTSAGLLSVWQSKEPMVGEVSLGGNGGAPAMYVIAVLPRTEPPTSEGDNYVVVVRGDVGAEPIGMQSAFGSERGEDKPSVYPGLDGLAVYEVAGVFNFGKELWIKAAPDAPFPHGPGRATITESNGDKIDVAYETAEGLPEEHFVVTSVQLGGSEVVVTVAEARDVPLPGAGGPGVVRATTAHGQEVVVPYTTFALLPAMGFGHTHQAIVRAEPGHLFPAATASVQAALQGVRMLAPQGVQFPPDAELVTPAAQFPISGVSPDGTRMRVMAPDDGSFRQGPSEMRVRLLDKSEQPLPYSKVVPVPADAAEPAGLLFISRAGEVFPSDAMLAGPAAGPALAVEEVDVQTAADQDYRIGAVGIGKKLYVDSEDVFLDVPDVLLGEVYMQTAEADSKATAAEDFLSFRLSEAAYTLLLIPSPTTRASWLPYWFPDFMSGGFAEELPEWVRDGFEHTKLEVLSSSSRFEVFISKSATAGKHTLGGNMASPARGDRGMYVVLLTARNVKEEALAGSQHHSTWKVPGKGAHRETASQFWTGASEQGSLCALSWFPVTRVQSQSLMVQAPEESFGHGPADVVIQSADGTEATYRYAKATSVPPSSTAGSQHVYLLTAETDEWPTQAAYARPTPTQPHLDWTVTSVSGSGRRITVDAPPSAFPPAPNYVTISSAGQPSVDVPFKSITAAAGGTVAIFEAESSSRFPTSAAFAAAMTVQTEYAGPSSISQVVRPDESGPTRYEVSTLGVGKRVYVDEAALFTAVPRKLAGMQYILTANADAAQREVSPNYCALTFTISRESYVYVALASTTVKKCSGPTGGCHTEETDPIWLRKKFTRFTDPLTGEYAVLEATDNLARTLYRSRKPMPSGEVCLGGRSAVKAFNEKDNYVVIVEGLPVPEHKAETAHPPVGVDGVPLPLAAVQLQWFPITGRSADGDSIRVQAKALSDGFAESHDGDSESMIVVKGCGAGESPYIVASITPAMETDYEPAGLTVEAGQGMTFPPCVAYARPFEDSLDSPASSHSSFVPKDATQHGRLAFTHTTFHVPANSTVATLSVSRTRGIDGPVSVRYYTSDGSAKRGSDYTEAAGTLIWADKEGGSKQVSVQLTGHPQSPQLFGSWSRFLTITLTHPTGGATIADRDIAVVRLDSDGEFHEAIPKEEPTDTAIEPPIDAPLPWEFAVTEVTGDGRRMRLSALGATSLEILGGHGALAVHCVDGREYQVNYMSAAKAAPAPFTVLALERFGMEMVLAVRAVAVPPGPGVLRIATRDGKASHYAYETAEPAPNNLVHVRVIAPAGFPFPLDAVSASSVSEAVISSSPHRLFPMVGLQSAVSRCKASPSHLPSWASGFPVSFLSQNGDVMRVEAPADAVFAPSGRLSVIMPDGTKQTRWYHSVSVVPPRAFEEVAVSDDGSELHVTVHKGASIPAAGGDVLVRVGKGPQQLVPYSHAMPSQTHPDQAVLYVQPGHQFPAKASQLSMATTGLLFKAFKHLPFPGTDLDLPVSELVVTPILAAQDVEYSADVFPVVEVSSDGSVARLAAPVRAAAHHGGVLMVQGSDGSVTEVAYRSAGEVNPEEFEVHTVDADGGAAVVSVGDRVSFPPGPGQVTVTTPDGKVGQIDYLDAVAVDSCQVRVTASAPHAFPSDALSLTPTLPALLVRAQGWSRFPAKAADGPVATFFAHSLPVESKGGWPVTAVVDDGETLRIYAQATAPIPPASVVEVMVPEGPVQQFAYDSVTVAPPYELEVKQILDEGRRLLLKVGDVALAPEGVIAMPSEGGERKLLAYDSLVPGQEDDEVVIALVRGDIVPMGTSTVAQHPPGLLLHSPQGVKPVLAEGTAGGAVSVSWAGVIGHSGMHRYAVTGQSADHTVIRVEAPPELEAWEAHGEWGVQLQQADGTKLVLPVESVSPAQEEAIEVLHVSPNGVVAILNIHTIAAPPPPATVLATSSDGVVKRVRYVSASSVSPDDFSGLPAGMPPQPKGAVLVRVVFPPGYLLPLDTKAISPIGGLKFTSPDSAPFPSLVDGAIATAFASPAPPPIQTFPVTFVRNDGSELGLQVPDGVRPFMGSDSGMVVLRASSGVEERLPYHQWKRESGATYQVAFVQTGGAGIALHPRSDRSFPPGPGVLKVTGKDGKSEEVRYSRAGVIHGVPGAGTQELIVVVAASGMAFQKGAAKATTGPVDVLVAGPGIKFDGSLASSLLAESQGRPDTTKTRVLHADVSHGQIDAVDVLDGEEDVEEHAARSGYPFQYSVLWLARGGKEMELFVPEGTPLPIEVDGELNLLVECPQDGVGQGTEVEVAWEAESVQQQLKVAIVEEGDVDHLDLVIELEAGRAFPPGPGMMELTLDHGKVVVAAYDSVTPLGSPSYPGGAHKVAVTAPKGLPFPSAPEAVRPLGSVVRVSSMAGELFPSKFRDGCFAVPRPAVAREANPKPAQPHEQPEHHHREMANSTAPHEHEAHAWRWLKPHPAVSSLLAESSFQYLVGVLGNGKRGYLDSTMQFRGVPLDLVGRPYVLTATADASSQAFQGFLSMFLDEPTDLHILLPPDQPAKKSAKKASDQSLSWLPFSLTSLTSSNKPAALPAWIQQGFDELDSSSSFAVGDQTLRVFKSRKPLIGRVELGGRSASPAEGSPRMYIPVLVPSTAPASEAEEWAGELEVLQHGRAGRAGDGKEEKRAGIHISNAELQGMELACGGQAEASACVTRAHRCVGGEALGDAAACTCFAASDREGGCAPACMDRIRVAYDKQVLLHTGRTSPCASEEAA